MLSRVSGQEEPRRLTARTGPASGRLPSVPDLLTAVTNVKITDIYEFEMHAGTKKTFSRNNFCIFFSSQGYCF